MKDLIGWLIVLFVLMLCIDYTTTDTAAAAAPRSKAYRIHIIREVWGSQGDLGIRIARCEDRTLDPAARDYLTGSHWGLFQEDSDARKTYGWGSGAWKQARSGYKLFKARGTSPWASSESCWNG